MDQNFLKKKYDLHNASEVESAAHRTQIHTGEKVPQTPEAQIQNYLNRFKEVIERKDPDKRERGIEAIKKVLYDKFVIKPGDIPEGYYETQKRIAREQGHGDIEISQEQKEQLAEVIITDQQTTLDNWIDYLSSPDAAVYPDWLKYYAIRSILGMGDYDKEKKQFTKRSKGTTKPFPDLNREALAYVLDAIEKKYQGQNVDLTKLSQEDQEEFQKLISGENFGKLYSWAIEKVTPESIDQLANIQGKWVKYDQNSDHMPLVESLQGHGTGWCTAGESTAKMQLSGGDFYVYYSQDKEGSPTIPRVAIRMQGDSIGEIRGIAPDQNMDPYITDVVKEKLKEFTDGSAYEKKNSDMKRLTSIDNKNKKGEHLIKEDLVFLYEIDSEIEGFGYQRDPRIKESRDQRNPQEDMPIVFECEKDQIAHNIKEISKDTKAYVGPLVPGIFDKLQKYNIENIYTSFPEGKIRKENIEIGGKSTDELIQEMREKKINISDHAMDMLKSKEFTVLEESESAVLIRLKVGDLGFPKGKCPTTDEIYKRIEELGLELCPAEVGPQYRLQYAYQPIGNWFRIGMKSIVGRDGNPDVFSMERRNDDLWLNYYLGNPDYRWDPGNGFVFRLSKHKEY
jgi:hypothetical protein